MTDDAVIIIYLGSFPIFVGAAATLIVLLVWRFTSRECPHCFRRIPTDAFKHGVPCPDCETELGESGQKLSLLSEEMPYSLANIAWRMFLFTFAGISGFALVIALLGSRLGGDWIKALQVFVVIFMIGSPVILLFTAAGTASLALRRLKVISWKDLLIVRDGMRLRIAPLAECSWREGKVSEMTVLKTAFLLRGHAIIVDLPIAVAKEGNRVAVGFTDETRQRWLSLFEAENVPRTPAKKRWW